jgi:hypothetical protein
LVLRGSLGTSDLLWTTTGKATIATIGVSYTVISCRYPAHPSGDGRWKFPGIGEFQCHDKYMMEDLMAVASQEGKPQWGSRDPPNTGCYNSFPSGVPFFEEGNDSFLSDYGRFFLVCSIS